MHPKKRDTMGIYIRCTTCKSDYQLGTKCCKKCPEHPVLSGTNKTYKVAVKTPTGKRVVRLVESLALARRVESSLKGKVAEKKILGTEEAPTFDEIWEKYIRWAKSNKKSAKDDKNRWDLHIKPYLGGKKLDQVLSSDIQNILISMQGHQRSNNKAYSPQTIKHIFGLIRRLYNWSSEQQLYLGPNPTVRIRPPKVNNQKTECLTKNEVENLLKTLELWPNRLGALVVEFALFTGLRLGEVLGLKWQDVDMEKGFVVLNDPKGKPAILPISPEAKEILKKTIKLKPSPDCPYIFPNNKGQRRVSFNKIWLNIRRAAKLPDDFRFHGLRHTFASYLASSGKVDLYTLQKILNHQSPQMTQRYAHLLDEALRRGANVAGEIFGAKKE